MSAAVGSDAAGVPARWSEERARAREGVAFYALFVPLALYLPRYGLADLAAFWMIGVAAYVAMTRRPRFRVAGRWELLGLLGALFILSVLATAHGLTFRVNISPVSHADLFLKAAKNVLVAYSIILIVERVPINLKALMEVLFFALLVNLAVVFLQIAFFDFQTWTMKVFSFAGGDLPEARFVVRAHGLTMAYNGAALVVVFLMVVGLHLFHSWRGRAARSFLVLTFFACWAGYLLTARVGLATAAGLLVLYMVVMGHAVVTLRRLSQVLLLALVVAAVVYWTLDVRDEIRLVANALLRLSVDAFVKDLTYILVSALDFSAGPAAWAIGTGASPWTPIGAHTDNGYGQMFWQGGVVGLAITIFTWFYIALSRNRAASPRRSFDERRVLGFFMLAILISSVKADYFFSRILFETVLLLWAALGRRAVNGRHGVQRAAFALRAGR